jgi:hypothetical protein
MRTEAEVKALWEGLAPRDRRVRFKMGNSIIVHRPWSELDKREKDIIRNAVRIVDLYAKRDGIHVVKGKGVR